MEISYVIQNLTTNDYWYGNYTNVQWISEISKAKFYSYKEDAENDLKERSSGFYAIVKVYSK